ncbi:MAG: YlxR family protein [Lachnospiraceae bacterium]|nr:YlxR family protein [Lachnospiraceae bacterium]
MTKKTAQPERKCVGCGEMKPKKELIRIVRTKEGQFHLDRDGRMNGRGAYLCPDRACLAKAEKSRGLERSFRGRISSEIYQQLNEEMNTL